MAEKRKEKRSLITLAVPVLMVFWLVLVVAEIASNFFIEEEEARTVPVHREAPTATEEMNRLESGLPAEAEWGNEDGYDN